MTRRSSNLLGVYRERLRRSIMRTIRRGRVLHPSPEVQRARDDDEVLDIAFVAIGWQQPVEQSDSDDDFGGVLAEMHLPLVEVEDDEVELDDFIEIDERHPVWQDRAEHPHESDRDDGFSLAS